MSIHSRNRLLCSLSSQNQDYLIAKCVPVELAIENGSLCSGGNSALRILHNLGNGVDRHNDGGWRIGRSRRRRK
jgi:hypothetical protein